MDHFTTRYADIVSMMYITISFVSYVEKGIFINVVLKQECVLTRVYDHVPSLNLTNGVMRGRNSQSPLLLNSVIKQINMNIALTMKIDSVCSYFEKLLEVALKQAHFN